MHAHNPDSMRRHNERLVLTLLRRHGPLARSGLAQASGLTAQSMSNITRDLLARGLIAAEGPVRGRVGQPSVPVALAPNGAFFLGLQVGRRSAQMVLIDFTGRILGLREQRHPNAAPDPDVVIHFAAKAAADLRAELPAGGDPSGAARLPAPADRLVGLGIAMPFRLWDWGAGFAPWRGRDLRAEAAAATGLPTWLENDASCACAAELVFGRRDLPGDFLHVYVGYYAGGGLVLDGRLWLGPRGNAGAIGSAPVPAGVTGPGTAAPLAIPGAAPRAGTRPAPAPGTAPAPGIQARCSSCTA